MMEEQKKKKDDPDAKKIQIKTLYDYQRLKLDKLMKNPEKPVIIPDAQRGKKTPHVPEFVRNVMGSSAGAGSGEFHVYRHLRRKEYARQKQIQEKSEKELLDDEFKQKIDDSRKLCEDKTAKKRAKRLKKKQKLKNKSKRPKIEDKKNVDDKEECEESSNSDEESKEEEGDGRTDE